MRLYALWLVVFGMTLYCWKNWYRTVLFLVLVMAIVERPDFPKAILGIPGLNPWNLLLFFTGCAFLISNDKETDAKLPPGMIFLLITYLFVVILAFVREIIDLERMNEFFEVVNRAPRNERGVFIDHFINTLKYIVPGFLIYFGCKNYTRLNEAIVVTLVMNGVLALLVIRSMGFDALTSGSVLEATAIRRLDRDVGYFRSDVAILLAGGSWAMFAYSQYTKNKILRLGFMGMSALTGLAVGLTGGRMGMAAWGILAMLFGVMRWRKILLMGPLVVVALIATVPAVQERFLQGFGNNAEDKHEHVGTENVNLNSVTSGRVVIWPTVIEGIFDRPFFGGGRETMQRHGISLFTLQEFNKPFSHPHNAYLQLLLDNGFVLGIPVLILYIWLVAISVKLIKSKEPHLTLVGSFAFAFIVSFLAGGIAQQSFYPVISSVSMWVAIFVMLRVYYSPTLGKPAAEVAAVEQVQPEFATYKRPLWQRA